jgi:hypothetical protein
MQHGVVIGLILIPVIAFLALAVYVYGADSRVDDIARRRRFNG